MGIKTCQRIWGVIQPNLGRGTLASGTAFADRHRGRVFRIQKNICAELSQITWRRRHRSKGHHADIWRRPGAKHCSSLCSQSEGGEYCGGQALKIQQSHAPERWSCSLRVRGPHFASKVSYNAGAATDDCAVQSYVLQGQRKSPQRGRS